MLSCRVQQPLVGLWTSDVGRGEAGEEGVGGKVKRSEERDGVRQRDVCVRLICHASSLREIFLGRA